MPSVYDIRLQIVQHVGISVLNVNSCDAPPYICGELFSTFSVLTSIPYAPALSYVGEIFKFTAEATHEVNVISESQVGNGSFTNGDRGVMVMESPALSSR